jgi:hypothetical protein
MGAVMATGEQQGMSVCVRCLLENEADVRIQNKKEETPWDMARLLAESREKNAVLEYLSLNEHPHLV